MCREKFNLKASQIKPLYGIRDCFNQEKISHRDKTSAELFCEQHATMECKLWCTQCNVKVCEACIRDLHDEHTVRDLRKHLVRKIEEKLGTNIQEGLAMFSKDLEKINKVLDKRLASFGQKSHSLETIRSEFQLITDRFEKCSYVMDDGVLSDLTFLLKLSEFDFRHYDSLEFLESRNSVAVQTEKGGSDKATQSSTIGYSTSKSIQTTNKASYSSTITFKVNGSSIFMEILEVPQYTFDFATPGRETIVAQILMKISSRRPPVIVNSPKIRYKNADVQVSASIKPCEAHKHLNNCGESSLCFVLSCCDNGGEIPGSKLSPRRFKIDLVKAVNTSIKKSSNWVDFTWGENGWKSLLSSLFFRRMENWVDSNDCFSVDVTAVFNSPLVI